MATVRGYEPLSGKHEVLYRGDIPWEFLSLGDPCNHIRYCQPVPPASLNSVQEMQHQQQRRRQQQQLKEEEGGDTADEVVNVMDVDPPSPLSAHPHLPGGVNERDRDGSPPPEKGVPLEAAGGGGARDESVTSPRGGDAATAAVAVRKEKARDGGAGGTSESVSVGDRHRVIDGERHAGRSDEAAAAAAVAAAGPSAEDSGTARGEAAVLAHEEEPAKLAAKRKRGENQDADEDGAKAAAKRKREEDGTGGAGGSVASVGLPLIPAPPAAGAAETPEGAFVASMGVGGSSERDGAKTMPMVNDVVRSAEAPAQRSRPTAAAAAAATVGGAPADARQELSSGKGGGINAAPKAVEIPAVCGAAVESTKRPQSTEVGGNAKLPHNCTAAASGPGVSGEGGECASTWVEVDGSGGGGGSSSSQARPMPAAGPNGLPPQGTATSSAPADGTVASAGAGGSDQRPRSMMATPPLPPSLDGARADWRAQGMAGTTQEEKGERPEGMKPHVLEGGRESSRDQPLPHQPSATDSTAQRGGGDGGGGAKGGGGGSGSGGRGRASGGGGRSSGGLRIQAPTAAGGSGGSGGKIRSRLRSNSGSGSSSNSSPSPGGNRSPNGEGHGAVGSRGTKRYREDGGGSGWHGAVAAVAAASSAVTSTADERASKDRRSKSPRR
ncbi:unnamed protein product [Ectocarpus sp. 13 AM-2016]